MKKCYCDNCEKSNNCGLAFIINFCIECKHYHHCDLLGGIGGECDAGHEIECNNGFEPEDW